MDQTIAILMNQIYQENFATLERSFVDTETHLFHIETAQSTVTDVSISMAALTHTLLHYRENKRSRSFIVFLYFRDNNKTIDVNGVNRVQCSMNKQQ